MPKHLRTIAEFLTVGVCTVALAFTMAGICAYLLEPGSGGGTDFVEYWASGNLLAHHRNPYSAALLMPVERSAGFPSGSPALVMANPPWSLPLVVPLSLFGPGIAKVLWFLLSVACLVASVRMVWRMHGSPKTFWNVLGYTFAPALICLLAGQITIFALFGLVLFLRFHRSRPFLAGSALWFCMLKPHIFVPFGVALLLWVIFTRKYKILLGLGVALGSGSLIAVALDRDIWSQYIDMMRAARIDRIRIPCLGMVLRDHVWPHNLMVQCVPVVMGCAWSIYYFHRHRRDWNWLEHGSSLILVSVFVAPYTWLMDQGVVIPALLHALYRTQSRLLFGLLGLASAAIEIAALSGLPLLHADFYLWTAPGWLAWYWLAGRHSEGRRTRPPVSATSRRPSVLEFSGFSGIGEVWGG